MNNLKAERTLTAENRVSDEKLAEILANDERCVRLYPEIEAVKVLEEIISACEEVILFQGEQVTGHILKNAIDRSNARQFLATLGEENVG